MDHGDSLTHYLSNPVLTRKRNKIITRKVREENRNETSVGNFWNSSYGRNYRNTNFNTFSC